MDFLKKDLNNLISNFKKWWFLIFIPIVLVVALVFVISYNNKRIETIESDIKNGNFSEAESMLIDYKDANPSSVEIYGLYADFYLAQNEPEAAIVILEEGLRKVSSESQELLQSRIDKIKSEYSISDETDKVESSEDKKASKEETKQHYLTETIWAAESNYVFAVETDSYDGDVFEKGTYRFYPDLVTVTGNEIPIVWDIYVSDELYSSMEQVLDTQLKATVGGINNLDTTLELKKGQYVYVVYNKPASTPTGVLKIEKQ